MITLIINIQDAASVDCLSLVNPANSFIIPTVQVSLFCLAIGRDPKGMTVAVVNEEVAGGCVSWSEGCLLASQDLDFNSGDDEGWTDWDVTEPQDLYQVIIPSL